MHFKIKRLLKWLNYDNISQYNFFAVLFFFKQINDLKVFKPTGFQM